MSYQRCSYPFGADEKASAGEVLVGALSTAWRFRVEKNIKAKKTKRTKLDSCS